MSKRIGLLLLIPALVLLGAPPLATVTHSPGLALNGNSLAATGVSSWPLVAGDSLATTTTAAMVVFPDQSRLALEKNSRVKLEQDGDKVVVRLLEGALAYRLGPGSRVQLSALGRSLTPASNLEGKVSIVGRQVVEGAVPPGTFSGSARPASVPTHTPSKFK